MSEGKGAGSSGLKIGAVLALILSWTTNHSILYAILHACLSWAYVVYWVLTYKS